MNIPWHDFLTCQVTWLHHTFQTNVLWYKPQLEKEQLKGNTDTLCLSDFSINIYNV